MYFIYTKIVLGWIVLWCMLYPTALLLKLLLKEDVDCFALIKETFEQFKIQTLSGQ